MAVCLLLVATTLFGTILSVVERSSFSVSKMFLLSTAMLLLGLFFEPSTARPQPTEPPTAVYQDLFVAPIPGFYPHAPGSVLPYPDLFYIMPVAVGTPGNCETEIFKRSTSIQALHSNDMRTPMLIRSLPVLINH